MIEEAASVDKEVTDESPDVIKTIIEEKGYLPQQAFVLFLAWTIFKVFIGFVTILLPLHVLFYFFVLKTCETLDP